MESYMLDGGRYTVCIVDFRGETWYLLENIPGKQLTLGTIKINRGYPPRGILYVCDEFGRNIYQEEYGIPKRVSVKVDYLRPRYDNLQQWIQQPGHILCTRRGRVFITDNQGKYVFTYPESPWANPYTVKDYGLDQALVLYENYLHQQLTNPQTLQQFTELSNVKELGCFCAPHESCHVDVIIKLLKSI